MRRRYMRITYILIYQLSNIILLLYIIMYSLKSDFIVIVNRKYLKKDKN